MGNHVFTQAVPFTYSATGYFAPTREQLFKMLSDGFSGRSLRKSERLDSEVFFTVSSNCQDISGSTFNLVSRCNNYNPGERLAGVKQLSELPWAVFIANPVGNENNSSQSCSILR